ncbi:unnamed protein product [Dibothriocephalus latus]|uniref:Uncharacterized protein n=1 Tax=Dibothriocephalus latus TaxID=60516 RepID=A0A3P7NUT5_DIBLA|nr:unnamed protein product [Dibothriocephalus latus]
MTFVCSTCHIVYNSPEANSIIFAISVESSGDRSPCPTAQQSDYKDQVDESLRRQEEQISQLEIVNQISTIEPGSSEASLADIVRLFETIYVLVRDLDDATKSLLPRLTGGIQSLSTRVSPSHLTDTPTAFLCHRSHALQNAIALHLSGN